MKDTDRNVLFLLSHAFLNTPFLSFSMSDLVHSHIHGLNVLGITHHRITASHNLSLQSGNPSAVGWMRWM